MLAKEATFVLCFVALSFVAERTVNAWNTCENYYLDDSCAKLRGRNMCRMFNRYCRRTCGLCRPETTKAPVTVTRTIPNTWSPCTKTCGTGTTYKFDSQLCEQAHNPKCTRTYRECNTKPCEYRGCRNNQEKRHGRNKGCCKSVKSDKPRFPTYLPRIFGGKPTSTRRWPWMVLVATHGEVCGGTLVHPQWVLTAAHCVRPGNYRLDIKKMFVYAGVNDIIKDAVLKNQYSVRKVILHSNPKIIQNDVALIKLTKYVPSNRAVPISLPQGEETPIDGTCFATGWGLSNPSPIMEKTSERLMEVHLQVFDINVCRKSYNNDRVIGRHISNPRNERKLICAGSLTQRNGLCHGDSGGPLVCQRCSSCEWYVAGVTSFRKPGTCNFVGVPSIFSKVTNLEKWIRRNIPSLKADSLTCPYTYGP